MLFWHAINSLRLLLKNDARIFGIITEGGRFSEHDSGPGGDQAADSGGGPGLFSGNRQEGARTPPKGRP